MPFEMPRAVQMIIQTLNRAGYDAYAVGGCVRDSLLGRMPKDWDVCTSALPEQVMTAFPGHKIYTVGIQHGTVVLPLEGENYEITTFRTDGAYSDHRHPDEVRFVRSLREDLARRDFTINAMACHPELGLQDCFGGQEDLKNGLIRCVGNPEERFEEDGLRILRALRFAARYGFTIEPATARAIHRKAELLRCVAGERIWTELRGILAGPQAGRLAEEYRDVLAVVIPELTAMFDFPQRNPHHCFDVWTHTCRALDGVRGDGVLGFVLLLHDSGKPACQTRDARGIDHFHGHPKVSAELAEQVLERFRCDNRTRESVSLLILWHDYCRAPRRRGAKRLLAALGSERTQQLFHIAEADARAQSPETLDEKLETLERWRELVAQLEEENACLHTKDLAVSGRDLIALGCKPGPDLGRVLNELLEAVLRDEVPNERDALLKLVKKN